MSIARSIAGELVFIGRGGRAGVRNRGAAGPDGPKGAGGPDKPVGAEGPDESKGADGPVTPDEVIVVWIVDRIIVSVSSAWL